MAGAAVVLERPDERRPRVEIPGQLGKADVIGVHAGDDLVADLPDGRAVVAQKPRGHFLGPGRPVLLPHAHERDVAADVLAEQLLGLEQVVLVVLLEDAQPRRLAERAEVDGGGIDGRRDVHEPQLGDAAREPQVASVANERDVGVVDRDGQIDLIVDGRLVLQRRRAAWRRRCDDAARPWRRRRGRLGQGQDDAGGEHERRKPEANGHETAPFKEHRRGRPIAGRFCASIL